MSWRRWADGAAIAATLVACLLGWLVFWNFGALGLISHDWPKEAFYYDVLRGALAAGRLPYYVDRDAQATSWFLAIPEVPLSPQLVLLLFLDNGAFATANGIVLWMVGVIGCLLYRRRYHVATIPFLFVLLLFSFNGHIVAHLAVGHSMWVGYFLSPFAVLAMFRLVEDSGQYRDALTFGVVLAAMMLLGAFHLAVYFALLAGVVALLEFRRLAAPVAFAFAACGLLAAVKVVPALAAFAELDHAFMTGYPGLGTLVESLTSIRPPDTPRLGSFTEHRLGWWEFDAYVSLAGLAFLTFGLRPLMHADDGRRPLVLACLILVALSFGEVIYLLSLLGMPVLGQERVASRILVASLVCLLFLAGRAYTEATVNMASRHDEWSSMLKLAALIALALTVGGLIAHLLEWRVAGLEAAPREPWHLNPLEAKPSRLYEGLWQVSFAISAAAWMTALVHLTFPRARRILASAHRRLKFD